ncbi:MAG: hypothetical protein ACYTKD_00990 [Planctomycetota bacterium]|jgi:hypothetical protein
MDIRTALWACAAVAALGGAAGAIEGEPTPRTLEKLAMRVNIEEGAIPLVELAGRISEQTGLSFVASAHVAHMPEPVAIVARDVPASEVLEAVAFSMDLEFRITPGGMVAIRLDHEDPRREAIIDREFRRHEREHDEGGGDGERREREEQIVDRVTDQPKVRGILDKVNGHLVVQGFHEEKGVWVLTVRREDERGPPLAHVIADEDGNVIDIKFHDKWGGGKERKEKGFGKEHRGKHPEREEPFREDEARERRENF